MLREASVAGPMGRCCSVVLSQGSCQALIESLFPTTHPIFSLSRFLPNKIPLHPWDIADFSVTLRKLSELQYFPMRILVRRISGLWRILQLRFPRKSSLKARKSRNPSPLIALGFVMLSHETQAILCCPSLSSHQNLVTSD